MVLRSLKYAACVFQFIPIHYKYCKIRVGNVQVYTRALLLCYCKLASMENTFTVYKSSKIADLLSTRRASVCDVSVCTF